MEREGKRERDRDRETGRDRERERERGKQGVAGNPKRRTVRAIHILLNADVTQHHTKIIG